MKRFLRTAVMPAALTLIGLSVSILASGCYTTIIRNGKTPNPPTVAYDARWHHGILWGIAELSGPYDLSQICPQGWAEIKTETSFLNGLLSSITNSIYSSQTLWVRCSAAPAPLSARAVQPLAAPPVSAPPPPPPSAPADGAQTSPQ
jgi:hypothetical protein